MPDPTAEGLKAIADAMADFARPEDGDAPSPVPPTTRALRVYSKELVDFARPDDTPNAVVGRAPGVPENECSIENLRRVNICVGPNNSGKSRFLRALALAEKVEILDSADTAGVVDAWRTALADATRELSGIAQSEALRAEIGRDLSVFEQTLLMPPTSVGARRAALLAFAAMRGRVFQGPEDLAMERLPAAGVVSVLHGHFTTALRHSATWVSTPSKRVYIPPIRSLRLFSSEAVVDDYFREAYGFLLAKDAACELFTGRTFHKELKEMALGGAKTRSRLAAFESFLSEACFAGRPVSVSPKEGTGKQCVEIQLGEDDALELDHVGDGIAQVILLTFPVFFEPERIFLIDEPETHLHPALQRAVVAVYAKTAKGPVFMSTHSNHLIDMAADHSSGVGVLRFRKDGPYLMEGKEFHVDVVEAGSLTVLDDLGVRLSSVARVNAVIWVEGARDREYLWRLFQIMGADSPPLTENLHYGFAEYGGSAITHYSFDDVAARDKIRVLRIGGTPIVIADTDSGGKLWRDVPLSEQLGERFLKTPGREIENLLPLKVLRAVLKAFNEDEATVDSALPDAPNGFPPRTAYRDAALGTWLDGQLAKKRKRKTYAADSGTIEAKPAFCGKALAAMDGLKAEDFDPEVVAWVRDILDHIRKINNLPVTPESKAARP